MIVIIIILKIMRAIMSRKIGRLSFFLHMQSAGAFIILVSSLKVINAPGSNETLKRTYYLHEFRILI